jgi:hypothetical protein
MQNYIHYAIGFRQFSVTHVFSIAGMAATQGQEQETLI